MICDICGAEYESEPCLKCEAHAAGICGGPDKCNICEAQAIEDNPCPTCEGEGQVRFCGCWPEECPRPCEREICEVCNGKGVAQS